MACAFRVGLGGWLLLASSWVTAADPSPYLYILGVAQDAGYPQAGCMAPHCLPGWQNVHLRRGATSLALVDPADGKKYLFEATPDLPAQQYQLELQAPSEHFELAGIFLTHAHIGHYAGLMYLGHEAMGASNVPLFAMPRMTRFLNNNGPWSQLVSKRNVVLKPLADSEAQTLGQLRVTPFLVPHRDEYSETVGYRIDGPDKSALFIPDIDKWSRWQADLGSMIGSVDYALLDATFFSDGELPGRDMSKIPHPFVTETMQALARLPQRERNKVWFIHMNHSNPLLNDRSEQSRQVRAQGFNIAIEGKKLAL